nr:protein tweety homolog 3 [Vicugna pacos]
MTDLAAIPPDLLGALACVQGKLEEAEENLVWLWPGVVVLCSGQDKAYRSPTVSQGRLLVGGATSAAVEAVSQAVNTQRPRGGDLAFPKRVSPPCAFGGGKAQSPDSKSAPSLAWTMAALLLLGAAALACLALDLLFLLFYSFWLCCRRRKSDEWLGYLGFLLLDVAICLLVLVGLIRSSKGILVGVCLLGVLALVISWGTLGLELAVSVGSSDFCVDPDTYVTRMVEEHSVLSGEVLQYYLACSPRAANPFQQKLSGSHKALVEMQDVVAELLKTIPRELPATKDPLLRVQEVLNGTEVNLQHLTALVDCRSLHLDYVQALTGFCYDGVEGLIYLALFSFVTALMFSSIVCSVPHTWQQKRGPDEDGEEEAGPGPRQAHDSLYRVHMPSLYSCGSSYGSEASIPAAAHTVSNAPVTEYMSQNANFQNPRCENTPLIGRESPPPSYTSSMRAKYLATSQPRPDPSSSGH